jgi:MerR family copper efflux transcriptional regulator
VDLAADCKVYAVGVAMLIGELARRAGVTPQTIRYYESLGVVSHADRSPSGYRRYTPQALEELEFVRKAQSLGFSLEEIKQIVDLGQAGRAPCSSVLAIAERHLETIDQRIAELRELRKELTQAVEKWKDGGVPKECASTLCGLITGVHSTREAAPARSPLHGVKRLG